MPLDRGLIEFASAVENADSFPRPLCPVCQAGYLRFSAPSETENAESYRARNHEAWEPEWIFGTFVATAECENNKCEQKVHALGTYRVDTARTSRERYEDYSMSYDSQYSTFYTITSMSPPLVLMRLPETAPEEVREGVERASAVLLLDPGLAGTALRAAVERFLTTQGIPAKRSGGGFKSLDERIRDWKHASPNRASVADLLLAVKWIGNAGSHEVSDVSVKEVLDGVEILDEAFHRLFVGPDIDARAEAINLVKGPKRASLQ
ncbi:DUF4145 domain-containing protein [Parafrigoribacterium humi]|uniref:DUF4145 domain-containing protein n=1 Tax=Parafrigoribacterium humi TaxID=3144664 RepID=UPI0032EFB111